MQLETVTMFQGMLSDIIDIIGGARLGKPKGPPKPKATCMLYISLGEFCLHLTSSSSSCCWLLSVCVCVCVFVLILVVCCCVVLGWVGLFSSRRQRACGLGKKDVFLCCQAALALAKRGFNVDRCFMGESPGGVGQSLFPLLIVS